MPRFQDFFEAMRGLDVFMMFSLTYKAANDKLLIILCSKHIK